MSSRGLRREKIWNMEAQLWNMLADLGITDSYQPYCDEHYEAGEDEGVDV